MWHRALPAQSFDRCILVWLETPGVLVGLLMQYPCGRIKPSWIGQLRFALLPGDERGGGGALSAAVRRMKLAPVERTLWICVVDLTEEWPSRCSIHNVGRFLDADGEEVDGETAPFLSAFAITRCYRSGFQSSMSERQRSRSSRSPLAAPLYLSPRQVSPTGETTAFVLLLLEFSPHACFVISHLHSRRMTIWRTILGGNVRRYCESLPAAQPLIRPLAHNNNQAWKPIWILDWQICHCTRDAPLTLVY